MQEGVWPDLRLRGSLLGSTDLVDLVTGRGGDPRAARAQVRHDETRLFHVAVTRARHRLVVTAVRSEDEQPSPFLDVVDPLPHARPFTDVARPLTLPGLVAELRRSLVDPSPAVRGGGRQALAHAGARAGAAAPTRPSGGPCATPATTDPAAPAIHAVRGLALDRSTTSAAAACSGCCGPAGGDGPSMGAQDIGTLVHEIAHDLGDTDAATYAAELERRWGRLGLPPGWLSRRDLARATAMTERLATYRREASRPGWRRADAEVRMKVALGRAVVTAPSTGSRSARRHGADHRPEDGQRASRPRRRSAATASSAPTSWPSRGVPSPSTATGSGGAALLQLGRAATARRPCRSRSPLAPDDGAALGPRARR